MESTRNAMRFREAIRSAVLKPLATTEREMA
jgi:hypothetical protein